MHHGIFLTALICLCAPFVGSLIAGLPGNKMPKEGAHAVTIFFMVVSFICALTLLKWVIFDNTPLTEGLVYTWGVSGRFYFNIGLYIDHLTVAMMCIVTFVSLVVHVYSVAYMRGDPGDSRFFCYVSLFTFAMLLLVTANNFLQLFIGWEGVGLVSYLLIGFWFQKETAAVGSLKAFLINRVGDFGFILGIAAVLDYYGTLNYTAVFAKTPAIVHTMMSIFPGTSWSVNTVICILLFIGAMGKSSQVPLHVWLPESMEGPTPISALIHAATMVTAGVFMVARMSPMFQFSQPALSMVLVLGGTTAFFLGIVAWVQTDIKRIIAYSTISQLGYMMAGNGVAAYHAGIFHLMMHACFKALLFLSAGSVIIAMHHDQDVRNMGGLRKYMPITYVCFLIGALSLSAIPPFSGFYSKDAIIEAVRLSNVPGSTYAYLCVLGGAFVTAFYIFRGFFYTFHGEERLKPEMKGKVKENDWVVTAPLIALAIPSVFLGGLIIKSILYTKDGMLGTSIAVLPSQNILAKMGANFHGAWMDALHSVTTLPFWFAIAGIASSYYLCILNKKVTPWLMKNLRWIFLLLVDKFGFDRFNDIVFVKGGNLLARFLFRFADTKLLDDWIVDGSGRSTTVVARVIQKLQSGLLYQYLLVMIIGLLALLIWMVLG
ncbi:MAG: NADH-quinone oxidoreductase subunit L [Coxiellaceae bacterium]|nr:NADH-quinone oxidoreductase subunit L [Coxiellaceae bacterium]